MSFWCCVASFEMRCWFIDIAPLRFCGHCVVRGVHMGVLPLFDGRKPIEHRHDNSGSSIPHVRRSQIRCQCSGALFTFSPSSIGSHSALAFSQSICRPVSRIVSSAKRRWAVCIALANQVLLITDQPVFAGWLRPLWLKWLKNIDLDFTRWCVYYSFWFVLYAT